MINPEVLLSAYSQGIFPMAHEDGNIYWYEPHLRGILPLDDLHIPRRLRRKMNRKPFEIRLDSAFEDVIQACAEPAPGRETTWISDRVIESYLTLHRLGFAHSVEAWQDSQLVGGLYGVALRGLFAGESMFSRATDASKICLVHLVQHLKATGFELLDVQWQTDHLQRFGVVEISREEYGRRLRKAMQVQNTF